MQAQYMRIAMNQRSGCPINLSIEVLGDRWSVIVLRDMMFGNRRSYGELLANSLEGIATNILAARLKHLEAEELITASDDPRHKQKKIYSLTEKAIALVPIMVQLGAWGLRYMICAPAAGRRWAGHVERFHGRVAPHPSQGTNTRWRALGFCRVARCFSTRTRIGVSNCCGGIVKKPTMPHSQPKTAQGPSIVQRKAHQASLRPDPQNSL
jgi:DNA-binding HxlR family transcriptional regulator